MGKIIDFTSRRTIINSPANTHRRDAYLDFLRHVIETAHACGFKFVDTDDASAEHRYAHTRHRSRLAKLLANKR